MHELGLPAYISNRPLIWAGEDEGRGHVHIRFGNIAVGWLYLLYSALYVCK